MYTIIVTNKNNGVSFRPIDVFTDITEYASIQEASAALSKLIGLPGLIDKYDLEVVLTATADKLGVI